MYNFSLSAERAGSAGGFFVFLFWVHNVIFGGSSAFIALELLATGKATGVINAIAIALIWIGGSITFGLAALIHEKSQIVGSMTAKTSQ